MKYQKTEKDPLGLLEFIAHYPIKVIPLELYCKIFSDTREAIMKRLTRKTWVMGVHVKKPKGQNKLWVDLQEIENWVRDTQQQRKKENGTSSN